MKRDLTALLALWTLVGTPAVAAADDPNKVPAAQSKKTPEEQVRELSDAYENAHAGLLAGLPEGHDRRGADEGRHEMPPRPTSTPPFPGDRRCGARRPRGRRRPAPVCPAR